MEIWIISLAILAVGLDIAVTIMALKHDAFEKSQKTLQIILIWLFPFFSSIGFWMIYRTLDKEQTDKKPLGGGPSDSIGTNPVDIGD